MQARIWLVTLKYVADDDISKESAKFVYAKGQQEIGAGGFHHWQFVVYFGRPIRLTALKKIWKTAHAEPTKSERAESYCWKEDTRVADTCKLLFGKYFNM